MGPLCECWLVIDMLLMGSLLAPNSHPPVGPKWPVLKAQNALVKKEAL